MPFSGNLGNPTCGNKTCVEIHSLIFFQNNAAEGVQIRVRAKVRMQYWTFDDFFFEKQGSGRRSGIRMGFS